MLGSRGAGSGSPQPRRWRRLQRLSSVPGHEPNRVNDLILLRPEPDGPTGSGSGSRSRPEKEKEKEEERSGGSRHVVFFHGDIQVRQVLQKLQLSQNWSQVVYTWKQLLWEVLGLVLLCLKTQC